MRRSGDLLCGLAASTWSPVSWLADMAGPPVHRSRLSMTSAKAPVFFHERLLSSREAQHPHCESGQLLPPSLARAPQSLRLQESTSSDYLFTSEHLMGLQISRQISFQMIAPAMSFIWKSHCIYIQPAAGEQVCCIFYQLLIRMGNAEDSGRVTRELCAWQSSSPHPMFYIQGITDCANCTGQNFNLVPLRWQIKVWAKPVKGFFCHCQRKES